MTSPFVIFPSKAESNHTYSAPQAYPVWLQYVYIYMDDLICAAQMDAAQQQRSSELTFRSLKDIFP